MEPTLIPSCPSNIIIVDDRPANLQVLSDILKAKGYKVVLVTSGQLALDAAEKEVPDLILLDILMPEMDGYEVCRRFKEHISLNRIPVIFISVLDETEDKVRGFQTGGVDYITAPFQSEEVLARVEAQLSIHRYQKALAEKTRQLESSYRKLQEAENLRDQLTHMIVHDMRSLLNGVMGALQFLETDSEGKIETKCAKLLSMALGSTRTLTGMINNLLDVSKMEAKAMTLHIVKCDLVEVIDEALEKMAAICGGREIIKSIPPHQAVPVAADRDILLRVIINLLDNAFKFTDDNGTIVLGVKPIDNRVQFVIRDNGPGIPFEYQEKIFAKFGQVELRQSGRKCSTGLGLTFCKLAIEAHQGKIWVVSRPDAGSAFLFEIPGRLDNQPCSSG